MKTIALFNNRGGVGTTSLVYHLAWMFAEQGRKPMFKLKPADGAIGGYQRAVQECYRDFRDLAVTIENRICLTEEAETPRRPSVG